MDFAFVFSHLHGVFGSGFGEIEGLVLVIFFSFSGEFERERGMREREREGGIGFCFT